MTFTKLFSRLNLGIHGELNLANFADVVADLSGNSLLITEELPSGAIRSLTGTDVRDLVTKWSAAIAARSSEGEPVVIATPNGIDQFLLSLAAARVGRLPAPVNPQMSEREVEHVIADSGAQLVIREVEELSTGKGSRSTPPSAVQPQPNETAALFYTSGTTGKPKGAALSHHALAGHMAAAALVPPVLGDRELIVSLPVAHIMGFVGIMIPLVIGSPLYFMDRFSAERILDVIEKRRCSAFMGVPAMYRILLANGAAQRDLKSVRAWISGADVMPPELAREFKSFGAIVQLPGIGAVGEAMFLEGYGMVEVGGGVAAKVSPPFTGFGLGDSLGMALPGWKLRVADEDGQPVARGEVGELQVRGPGILNGYWGDETSSEQVMTADGWLHTGDLVKAGPMGSVVFQGRSKNVIISGGYTIYPVEVEALMEEHPAVAEVAVLGIADPKLGESVVAAVQLVEASGGEAPEAERLELELLRWAREHMAHYKTPRRIVFVDELPRTATRKVQRDKLTGLF